MTLKETATICAMIRKATFAWRNETEADFAETISIWHECLGDEPYEMARKAAAEYIRENNYPPTVADVYKPYKEYKEQRESDKKETINIYYRAIANYPCYEDTPDAQREYMRIIGKNPTPDKGMKFERDLIDFVRQHERERKEVPPFIEYMKGVKAIE